MNKVILSGNLTREPELRQTVSGKSRLAVGIAVKRNNKDADFFNLVAWDKTAEFIAKYFGKGSKIFIEGRLQTNNYDDKNGIRHYGVDVIVENVEFAGNKKDDFGTPVADEDVYQ